MGLFATGGEIVEKGANERRTDKIVESFRADTSASDGQGYKIKPAELTDLKLLVGADAKQCVLLAPILGHFHGESFGLDASRFGFENESAVLQRFLIHAAKQSNFRGSPA